MNWEGPLRVFSFDANKPNGSRPFQDTMSHETEWHTSLHLQPTIMSLFWQAKRDPAVTVPCIEYAFCNPVDDKDHHYSCYVPQQFAAKKAILHEHCHKELEEDCDSMLEEIDCHPKNNIVQGISHLLFQSLNGSSTVIQPCKQVLSTASALIKVLALLQHMF